MQIALLVLQALEALLQVIKSAHPDADVTQAQAKLDSAKQAAATAPPDVLNEHLKGLMNEFVSTAKAAHDSITSAADALKKAASSVTSG